MKVILLTICTPAGLKVYVGKTPYPGMTIFLDEVYEVKELLLQAPNKPPQFAFLCLEMGTIEEEPKVPYFLVLLNENSPIFKEYLRKTSGLDLTSHLLPIGGKRGD